MPCRRRKRAPLGIGVQIRCLLPIRPNVVWALVFQFDQTDDATALKPLDIIDELARELPGIVVGRSIKAPTS